MIFCIQLRYNYLIFNEIQFQKIYEFYIMVNDAYGLQYSGSVREDRDAKQHLAHYVVLQ